MLTPIPFLGEYSLDDDSLIPITNALSASDLFLDKDVIEPRCGYRKTTAAALATTGATQGAWRFRPTASSARMVTSIAGTVKNITDPSSQTASDGSVASNGSVFGATAKISAAQLGKYLYLATDEDGVQWQRMDSSYALTGLSSLPQAAVPTVNLGSLSLVKFTSLAAPTATNTTVATILTDIVSLTPTNATNSVIYNFGSDQNWTGVSWLLVVISPVTQSDGDGTISIAIATAAGAFEKLEGIYDTPGIDSPTCCYLPLDALTAATRAAARRISFTNDKNLKFYLVHGYMAVPSAPSDSPSNYYVTFYNSTNGQESPLSQAVSVTYSADAIVIPQFHSVPRDGSSYHDEGLISADPDSIPVSRLWNKGAGKSYPNRYEFASVPTFTGPIPTGDQNPASDTVRLWRQTSTGIRLVKTGPVIAAQTTYSITDDQGDGTLTHQLYRAGGTPPRANCLAARAQRLIAGYQNRVYISSFIPTSATSDPFPQFPDIPEDDSSGWSYDIAPSPIEQLQVLLNGDALYLLTNEATYVMTDLTPNAPPFKAFERGAIGRRAAIWAESELFFASYDGIYSLANRAQPRELTAPIRRRYADWFIPDSTVVLTYQSRKLTAWCGTRFLRYDFVKDRWTEGNTATSMYHAACFRDPDSRVQNQWMLDSTYFIQRWQPDYAVGNASKATTDNGTAIPAWVYDSGFEFTPDPARIKKVFLDVTTGPVQFSIHTSVEDKLGRVKEFRRTEHEETLWADLRAYKFKFKMTGLGGAICRRLLWDRMQITADGGPPSGSVG